MRRWLCFLAGGWVVFSSAQAVSPERPNVLLIVADDLGKCDMSVYRCAGIKTPNLDRLANSGARFSKAYATASICSPSRVGILTGRYPQRLGFEFQPHQRYPRNFLERWAASWLLGRDGWKPAKGAHPSRKISRASGLPPEAVTLAEALKDRGYRTGIFGKWHLGYGPDHHPLRHGFDTFFGFLEAYSLYGEKKNPELVGAPVALFADKVQWKKRRGPRAIQRDGQPVREDRYLTQAIAAEAIRFMQQPGTTPFFAYLPFSAPHAPWQAPKPGYDSLSSIKDHHQRVYTAMVLALDQAVGEILDFLETSGLSENTLIVFASDNGVATYNGHVTSGNLKGGKFTLFEGGIDVPLFFSWKNTIPPGQVLETPASLLDIAPTILEAAGGALPSADGLNWLPALTGKTPVPKTDSRTFFWRSGYVCAVRQGSYKVILDKAHGLVACYDLEKDPQESRDIHWEKQEKVTQMLEALAQWENTLAPPAWPHAIDYEVVIDGKKYYFAI